MQQILHVAFVTGKYTIVHIHHFFSSESGLMLTLLLEKTVVMTIDS